MSEEFLCRIICSYKNHCWIAWIKSFSNNVHIKVFSNQMNMLREPFSDINPQKQTNASMSFCVDLEKGCIKNQARIKSNTRNWYYWCWSLQNEAINYWYKHSTRTFCSLPGKYWANCKETQDTEAQPKVIRNGKIKDGITIIKSKQIVTENR